MCLQCLSRRGGSQEGDLPPVRLLQGVGWGTFRRDAQGEDGLQGPVLRQGQALPAEGFGGPAVLGLAQAAPASIWAEPWRQWERAFRVSRSWTTTSRQGRRFRLEGERRPAVTTARRVSGGMGSPVYRRTLRRVRRRESSSFIEHTSKETVSGYRRRRKWARQAPKRVSPAAAARWKAQLGREKA